MVAAVFGSSDSMFLVKTFWFVELEGGWAVGGLDHSSVCVCLPR